MDFRSAFNRARLPISLAVLAGLFVWMFINAVRRVGREDLAVDPPGDSGHFYYAAEAMWKHADIYSYWAGPTGDRYIYPPLIAFLYMPLALLPMPTALTVLLVVNVVLLALAVYVATTEICDRLGLAADPGLRAAVAMLAVVLISDKLKGELQHWQTNVLLMLMFALALRLLDRLPWAAGAAMGFAFNIKYIPLVALPYFLIRQQWKAAGGFVAAAFFFAFLPAVWSGWDRNLDDLQVAYAGLLNMVGIGTHGAHAAHIIDITAGFSVSIPSALARVCTTYGQRDMSMQVIAAAGLAVLTIVYCLYSLRGARLFGRLPDGPAGRAQTAIEWAGLIAGALMFSPQTNTRHLCLLVIVQIAAVALVVRLGAGWRAALVVFGIILLTAGLVFPPGRDSYPYLALSWFHVGGPSWCLLAMYLIVLWFGLGFVRKTEAGPIPATCGAGSAPAAEA